MKVCGIEMGNVAVIVGVDDEALDAVVSEFSIAYGGSHGISDTRMDWLRTHDCVAIPDLGDSMHPSKHAAMVAALRASGVPFVATTHSPYLLDHFDPSEVIVLHDGRADRLSDHHDAKRSMEVLTTGEFYAASGWETP